MATRSISKSRERAAHPTVRFAPLELGGETYRLAFDFNAIAAAEQMAGVNLLQAMELRSVNAAQYRALFYAALKKAHPDMTLDDAGDLITMGSMPAITDALVAAWQASVAAASGGEENPPAPAPTAVAG